MRPRKLDIQNEKGGKRTIIKITSGAFHLAAIDMNGALLTWGDK